MANKDYASITAQPVGAPTKMRAEQIKSEDGFNSLAVDLEALRGQVKDIIGYSDYKEAISGSLAAVQMSDLANHIDASEVGSARKLIIKKHVDVALSASIHGDIVVDGNAKVGNLNTTAGSIVFHDASKMLMDNANLKFDGSDLFVPSLKDAALTSGRVVYAAAGGKLVDNSGLTFDGTDLTMASAVVSDLTSGRVVYAGASGALVDSSEMTFGAGGLTLSKDLVARSGSFSGDVTVSGNLNVMGATTTVDTQNLLVKDAKIVISSGGIVDGAGLYLADDAAGENIRWATADGGKWIASDKFAADTLQALDLSSALVWADADGNLVEVSASNFASYLAAGFGIDSVTTGTIVATEYTAGTGMHKSGFQFYIGQAVETTSNVTFAGVTAYLTGSGLTDGKLLKNTNGLVVNASMDDYIDAGTGVTQSMSGDKAVISIGQSVDTTATVTFDKVQLDGSTAYVDGGAGYLLLGFNGGSIPVAESGQVALAGFASTSIIGALNELAAGTAGGKGKWSKTIASAGTLVSFAGADRISTGSGAPAFPADLGRVDIYLNGQLMAASDISSISGANVTFSFNVQTDDVVVAVIR